MPYILKETLEEGEVEQDVVSREEYDKLLVECADARNERDKAIGIAESARAEAERYRQKYATAFIDTAAKVPERIEPEKTEPKTVQSFSELFNM